MRRCHLRSHIPKNAPGKRESETAGLSGELLIADDFLVARLGLGTMRLTGKGIWGPDQWVENGRPQHLNSACEEAGLSCGGRFRTADRNSCCKSVHARLMANRFHP